MLKSEVIVLKRTKYGESDLILHCLDSEGRKLSFFAKGALKSRKRFGGGMLEPSHHLEVVYKKKQSGESQLYLLSDARLLTAFDGLRTNMSRLEVAMHMLQLVDKFAQEGTVDSAEIFSLLGNGLKALEKSERSEVLKLHFEIKLLYQLGSLKPTNETLFFLKNSVRDHQQLQMSMDQFVELQKSTTQALQLLLSGQ